MNTLRLSIVATAIALFLVFAQVQTWTNSSVSANSVEQDEIKGAVEAYFAKRYRALSTLQPEGFENLIDPSPEGNAFLSTESDKLEIEIEHAKQNQLQYSRYEFFLDFKDISINPLTQVATVSVIEGHDVVFGISAVISPIEPI